MAHRLFWLKDKIVVKNITIELFMERKAKLTMHQAQLTKIFWMLRLNISIKLLKFQLYNNKPQQLLQFLLN